MPQSKKLVISLLFALLSSSCGDKRDKAQAPEALAELEAARELTQKGYRLKKSGQNARALELFEQAKRKLDGAPESQKTTVAVASNLDDFGTIYLRTGQYDKAKKHYEKAQKLLAPYAEDAPRLALGIDFRLTTLKVFEKRGIHCSEPLEPKASDKAEPDLPYLPEVRRAQKIFGKINAHLQGCRKGEPSPVNVRMVVAGDGRIVVAEPMGSIAATEAGRCIQRRILEASEDYAAQMPHFRACYRPFTYPFVVGDEEAWKNRSR